MHYSNGPDEWEKNSLIAECATRTLTKLAIADSSFVVNLLSGKLTKYYQKIKYWCSLSFNYMPICSVRIKKTTWRLSVSIFFGTWIRFVWVFACICGLIKFINILELLLPLVSFNTIKRHVKRCWNTNMLRNIFCVILDYFTMPRKVLSPSYVLIMNLVSYFFEKKILIVIVTQTSIQMLVIHQMMNKVLFLQQFQFFFFTYSYTLLLLSY